MFAEEPEDIALELKGGGGDLQGTRLEIDLDTDQELDIECTVSGVQPMPTVEWELGEKYENIFAN